MAKIPEVEEIIKKIYAPTEEDIALIKKAYLFAQNAHKDQKRDNKEPYFIHPVETAIILAELGKHSTTIAAGLLHDTLEDTGVSHETLEKEFSKEIAFLVEGVTKLGKLKYRGAKRHSESLRKLFIATSQDIRVIIIKLADRTHNMRTLMYVPEHKKLRIAQETLEIFAPIAYRLGIRKLNRELEDLAFPFVYPAQYKEIKDLTIKKHKKDLIHLERFHKSVQKILAKNGMTDIHTEYRIKGLYSLYKKYLRKEKNLDKIYDISALRIIVKNTEDCYKALGIIHSTWRPLPGRIKDYIAFPKTNGYQSLHTTVFTGDGGIVELQIKTKDMHKKAEYGVISYYNYTEKNSNTLSPTMLLIKRLLPDNNEATKNDKGQKISLTDGPKWLQELADYQNAFTSQSDFIKSLKNDFLKARMFVFTPKGDVVDLPIEATPVDFAYSIHTDVGEHMAGAKVNGRIVSLDSKLKNGDTIEIIIKKTAKPTRKWLEYAKTASAQRKIRNLLFEKEKKDGIF